jgi:hypothetical protein
VRRGGAGAERCWSSGGFRIEALERGPEWEPVFVVDGTGHVRRPGSDAVVAKFIQGPDGFPDEFTTKGGTLRCSADKTIEAVGRPFKLAYDEGDALTEKAMRVSIDDHGVVRIGEQATGPGAERVRFVGDAKQRRAAVLLVFVGQGL